MYVCMYIYIYIYIYIKCGWVVWFGFIAHQPLYIYIYIYIYNIYIYIYIYIYTYIKINVSFSNELTNSPFKILGFLPTQCYIY